jgi:hypothetical protein
MLGFSAMKSLKRNLFKESFVFLTKKILSKSSISLKEKMRPSQGEERISSEESSIGRCSSWIFINYIFRKKY